MPLYSYQCPACHTEFELLRRAADRDKAATCDSCGNSEARRSAASFAVVVGHSGSTGNSGASCGGGGSGFR